MRLTAHNARAGKAGVFSARHNDRNSRQQAEHIDSARTAKNWTWHCYEDLGDSMTFEDVEKKFYDEHFRQALDERNARSIKSRHFDRVQTMDDYRRSRKSCPEEQIFQVGRKGDTVSPEILRDIFGAHMAWMREHYPQYVPLTAALHVDEQGAPHIQWRGVWVAHDTAGREIVGQNKALDEMGVERPDPSKPDGRYNNSKMVYTAACREHLFALCRERGIEIEETPQEASRSGLSLVAYQARQEEERAARARAEVAELEERRGRLYRYRDAGVAAVEGVAGERKTPLVGEPYVRLSEGAYTALRRMARAGAEISAERADLVAVSTRAQQQAEARWCGRVDALETALRDERVARASAEDELAEAEHVLDFYPGAREATAEAREMEQSWDVATRGKGAGAVPRRILHGSAWVSVRSFLEAYARVCEERGLAPLPAMVDALDRECVEGDTALMDHMKRDEVRHSRSTRD